MYALNDVEKYFLCNSTKPAFADGNIRDWGNERKILLGRDRYVKLEWAGYRGSVTGENITFVYLFSQLTIFSVIYYLIYLFSHLLDCSLQHCSISLSLFLISQPFSLPIFICHVLFWPQNSPLHPGTSLCVWWISDHVFIFVTISFSFRHSIVSLHRFYPFSHILFILRFCDFSHCHSVTAFTTFPLFHSFFFLSFFCICLTTICKCRFNCKRFT